MKVEKANLHRLMEMISSEATEHDARVMLCILERDGVTDTDEVSAKDWNNYLNEVAEYAMAARHDAAVFSLIALRRACYTSASASLTDEDKRRYWAMADQYQRAIEALGDYQSKLITRTATCEGWGDDE